MTLFVACWLLCVKLCQAASWGANVIGGKWSDGAVVEPQWEFFPGRLTHEGAARRIVQNPRWKDWGKNARKVPVAKMTLSQLGAAVLYHKALIQYKLGNVDKLHGCMYFGPLMPECPHGYFKVEVFKAGNVAA